MNAVLLQMVRERIPAEQADVSILDTPLMFRNGRKAKNRFLKVSCHSPI